jgi:hypothetical protein
MTWPNDLKAALREQRPWAFMLAVDVVLFGGLIVNRLAFDYPNIQYSYLLVTYQFGLIKRGLLGAMLALFQSQVRYYEVWIIGGAVWLVTLILCFAAFTRIIGFRGDRLQLFAFTFGSPFAFKNFLFTVGFFDIYGCLVALVVLLIPMSFFFPLIVMAGCILLLLIHHLQFLLYVTTIAFIAIVRSYCLRPFGAVDVIQGLVAALVVCGVFVKLAFFGSAPVAPDILAHSMLERAHDPVELNISIWYSTIGDEIKKTAEYFVTKQWWRVPVYLALIALHWPVGRFVHRLIVAVANPVHRGIAIAAISGISAGYLMIFVVVYDYARWVSNWGVCMLLALFAIALLQSESGKPAPPFAEPRQQKTDLVLGWIITVIPRIGIYIPF